jgi:hypothetical protein
VNRSRMIIQRARIAQAYKAAQSSLFVAFWSPALTSSRHKGTVRATSQPRFGGRAVKLQAKTAFLLLEAIMTEAGISVEELHATSHLARGTITKARQGSALLRTTQVALFAAVVSHKRCRFLRDFRNRLLVDVADPQFSAHATSELRAEVMAGFGSYDKDPLGDRRSTNLGSKGGVAMFANIMKHMHTVELTADELEQPISVMTGGAVATIRDLIAEKAPSEVRAMFGTAAAEASGQHIKSVGTLDPPSLRRVAVEVLQKSDPDHRVAAIGLGEYTPKELIDEVQHQTVMGTRVVEAVRLSGLFMEDAVTTGKIRPKQHQSHQDLHLPDFEF